MTARHVVALAALCLASSAAQAQSFDDDAHERHQAELARFQEPEHRGPRGGQPAVHDGFYFRVDGGLGYGAAKDPSGSGSGYTGIANLGAYHVGGTVQDHALLGVQLWAAVLQNPTYKNALGTTRMSGMVGTLGLGPELTVYFVPSNLYVSSAAGLSWFTISSSSSSLTSKVGVGARVTVGAEWWLSRKWGAGLAAGYAFSSNTLTVPQTGGSRAIESWNLGLVGSLTYN